MLYYWEMITGGKILSDPMHSLYQFAIYTINKSTSSSHCNEQQKMDTSKIAGIELSEYTKSLGNDDIG